MIVKLVQYQPMATGTCERCDRPALYNLAVLHVEHRDRDDDRACPHPAVGGVTTFAFREYLDRMLRGADRAQP